LPRSLKGLLVRREIPHLVLVPAPAPLPHPFRQRAIGGARLFGG
jgi:hypothetical protein